MTVPRGFTRCDECGGKGKVHANSPSMSADLCSWCQSGESCSCPSCSGSGLVPTEKLREEATAAALTMWGRSFSDTADAVLRKVAEHIREER